MPTKMDVAVPVRDHPLDARRILVDVVELLCDEILMSEIKGEDGEGYGRRRQLSAQLDYFLERLDDRSEFGRVLCRRRLADLAIDLLTRNPYVSEVEETKRDASSPLKKRSRRTENDESVESENKAQCQTKTTFKPLIQFTTSKWEEVLTKLEGLRELMLRRDANAFVVPHELAELCIGAEGLPKGEQSCTQQQPNAEINDELAGSRYFSSKYEELKTIIRINQSISHFRHVLEEEMLHAPEGRESVRISPMDIVKFDTFVSDHFQDDDDTKELLLSLLKHGKGSSRTRASGLSLKPLTDLMQIMQQSEEFDLGILQTKARKLLMRWSDKVLDTPHLVELGYGRETQQWDGLEEEVSVSTGARSHGERRRWKTSHAEAEEEELSEQALGDEETSKPAKRKREEAHASGSKSSTLAPEIRALVEARGKLKDDVTDPLEETCLLADAAASGTRTTSTQPAAGSQNPQKGSFLRKKATASKIAFDDTDDESAEDANTLSEVPEPARIKPAHNEVARVHPSPSESTTSYKRGRKRFTDDEKTAIKLGVQKFGFGKWAQIKAYYRSELRDRTSVNIKDCYRTMMRNNEV